MIREVSGRLAPLVGALALLAGAADAQDVSRLTVRQVYQDCPAALTRYAPQLTTPRAQIAYRDVPLARAGMTQPQLRHIGDAIREHDCSDAEFNSALDADEAAEPDRSRDHNPSGSPPRP